MQKLEIQQHPQGHGRHPKSKVGDIRVPKKPTEPPKPPKGVAPHGDADAEANRKKKTEVVT